MKVATFYTERRETALATIYLKSGVEVILRGAEALRIRGWQKEKLEIECTDFAGRDYFITPDAVLYIVHEGGNR